jgi:hypothetical protein
MQNRDQVNWSGNKEKHSHQFHFKPQMLSLIIHFNSSQLLWFLRGLGDEVFIQADEYPTSNPNIPLGTEVRELNIYC